MTDTHFIFKYQPIQFDDYCKNEYTNKLLDTLSNLISLSKINIMLLGGPGSGKTVILNSIINYYFQNESNFEDNILNINNLKDQGINFFRNEVKTFCQTCSNIKDKKKIIILDDIDLINEQSQQVFRNFIDKYNHNVIFISSCSNIQKVIESLQSRFIINKLSPIDKFIILKLFHKIKTQEEISITPEAETFIINLCNNNIKILLNFMEKFKLFNNLIDYKIANHLCCHISFVQFEKYTKYVLNKEIRNALNIIYSILDKGYSVMDILDNYFIYIKHTNLLKEETKFKIIPLICKYITIFYSIHEDDIELSLFTNNLINIVSQ